MITAQIMTCSCDCICTISANDDVYALFTPMIFGSCILRQ